MKVELLNILRCPYTGSELKLKKTREARGEVQAGLLTSADGARQYPIAGGIPRFVPVDNYAGSFGFQWNRFRKTQLDSHTGVPVSRKRFFDSTEWSPEEISGKLVLEVGCGAGRFTEVALSTGATVVSVDYSSAVESCWENHQASRNLHVVQGDIYKLPFSPGSFDYVFCLGVLQHTPDVKGAFMALCKQLNENGRLSVDLYRKRLRSLFFAKYWLRPFTKRIDNRRLLRLVERWVPRLWPISLAVGRIPVLGRKLRHVIPVANYERIHPLSRPQLLEWAILDTFDMLSPAHDHPQSAKTLRSWFEEAGLERVKVFHPAHLVGNGARRRSTMHSPREPSWLARKAHDRQSETVCPIDQGAPGKCVES